MTYLYLCMALLSVCSALAPVSSAGARSVDSLALESNYYTATTPAQTSCDDFQAT